LVVLELGLVSTGSEGASAGPLLLVTSSSSGMSISGGYSSIMTTSSVSLPSLSKSLLGNKITLLTISSSSSVVCSIFPFKIVSTISSASGYLTTEELGVDIGSFKLLNYFRS
jgi:hypothetical protein